MFVALSIARQFLDLGKAFANRQTARDSRQARVDLAATRMAEAIRWTVERGGGDGLLRAARQEYEEALRSLRDLDETPVSEWQGIVVGEPVAPTPKDAS